MVGQLRRVDAARSLEFVADAQTIGGPEPFTVDLLDRLAAITETDIATYAEMDGAGEPRSHTLVLVRDTLPPAASERRPMEAVRLCREASGRGHHLVGAPRSTIQEAVRVGAVGELLRGRRPALHTDVAYRQRRGRCPPWPTRARFHRPRPADRLRAPAAHRCARAAGTRPPPPRGAPGCGRIRRRRRPAWLRHPRKRRRHRVRISLRTGFSRPGSATVSAVGSLRPSATGSRRRRATSPCASSATPRDSWSRHQREAGCSSPRSERERR